MAANECSLCYQKKPMTNERLRNWYCMALKVDAICDDCLDSIEKSRKEFMARKNANQGVIINGSESS